MKKNRIIGLFIAVIAVVFVVYQFGSQRFESHEMMSDKPIEDKRFQITDQTDAKYQSSVLINSTKKESEYGTGYVVGKDTVVTNKHVIYEEKDNLDNVVVRVGHKNKDGKVDFEEFKIKELVLPKEDYIDVAVLKLEKNAEGKSIGDFRKIAEFGDVSKIQLGSIVSVVGYPGDKEYATLWDSTGEVDNLMGDMISFRAITKPGNSGSPMFDSEGKVVAMNNAGGDNNSYGFLITEEILRFIQDNLE